MPNKAFVRGLHFFSLFEEKASAEFFPVSENCHLGGGPNLAALNHKTDMKTSVPNEQLGF